MDTTASAQKMLGICQSQNADNDTERGLGKHSAEEAGMATLGLLSARKRETQIGRRNADDS